MHQDFIRLEKTVPNLQFSLRYCGPNNFTGESVPGYDTDDRILFTKHAMVQLAHVQKEVEQDGYNLAIYDAYRPLKAVQSFINWGEDSNFKNKEIFYPELEKKEIFSRGFIAPRSAHSRGSTIDLTIIEKDKRILDAPRFLLRKLTSGREIPFYDDNTLDMGSSFDLFDSVTFVESSEITEEQQKRRLYLQNIMLKHGFEPYEKEWWHFTFKDEPFPDTYFDFDIKK